MKNGYQQAAPIDALIERQFQNDPITAENWMEWEKFIRVLRTTLDMLEFQTKPYIRNEVFKEWDSKAKQG